jgi:hypothetical protein
MRIDQTALSELGLYQRQNETVSIPSQRGRNVQGRRAVGETRQMIIDVVAASPLPLTRLQIARALGRSKTPHLVALIVELADSGAIVEDVRGLPNGMLEYRYRGR